MSTTILQPKQLEVAADPRLSSGVKAFLKALNSGDGPPLETLPPLEARVGRKPLAGVPPYGVPG